jgi:serine phosphatase RsbU (regulator of sigma subunit)
MLLLTIGRRWANGVVMVENRVFVPYAAVLLLGIVSQAVSLGVISRANRRGVQLPEWVWRATAILDVAVAVALLVIVAFNSPRGPIPALSAPAMLLLPLVVLTSILRLRPTFTLLVGLAGAAIHALLAVRAIVVSGAAVEPVHFAYSFILMMTAVAGMFVARVVRAHVRDAADEAAAHELSERTIYGMRRDLAVARDIQRGLLPNASPVFAGFDITGMNRPAEQTGGDYFDWQPLPDGRLAVVLADVSGHGIGPALVMAVCRAYARASAPMLPDPATLLTRLNGLLHEDLPTDRFITFALAVLDTDGGVQLISAGHGPTLLYRPSTGKTLQFEGDGMPLGVSEGEQYGPTTSLVMDDGDVLVMLTDGFFEWARPSDGEQFGIQRLQDAIRASAAGDAKAILHALDESVSRFCQGTPQSDDMTAIVIKRIAVTAVSPSPDEPEHQRNTVARGRTANAHREVGTSVTEVRS